MKKVLIFLLLALAACTRSGPTSTLGKTLYNSVPIGVENFIEVNDVNDWSTYHQYRVFREYTQVRNFQNYEVSVLTVTSGVGIQLSFSDNITIFNQDDVAFIPSNENRYNVNLGETIFVVRNSSVGGTALAIIPRNEEPTQVKFEQVKYTGR